MTEAFQQAFGATFMAVLRIFLIGLAAAILVRRRVLSQQDIKGLAAATINVIFPCMVFANILKNFRPTEMGYWWQVPLWATVMHVVAIALGALFFANRLAAKKNMVALAGIQNAAYLVLPLGQVLFPDQFDQFKLYIVLYVLAFNPVLWTVGKFLITSGSGRPTLKELLTPPFVANVVAVALVFLGAHDYFPTVLLDAIDLVGSATVPVANLVLGAVLGSIAWTFRSYWFDALRVVAIKLFILPLLVILALHWTGIGDELPLLAAVFVLEAAVPPATGLILQVRHYGGDEQKVGAVMLICYLAGIIVLPIWLAIWQCLG